MDDDVMLLLGRCLNTARQLEALLMQDSAELDACTRGKVLTEYRDAMEQAISLLRKIHRQLHIYHDERKLIT